MQKQNRHSSAIRIFSALLAVLAFVPVIAWNALVSAAAPQGNDWFEIHADPFTGKDDSGDGGTGNAADFNYFYVGQTFTANAAIKSNGTNAANAWIDFDPALVQPSNLSGGTYFNNSGGLAINNGRLKATGYNFPNSNSTGLGAFASFKAAMQKPSAANYGTGAPAILDFNTGAIGQTTESNIALNGADLLDDAKDFRFHVWADTKKPYALSPQPAAAATNVPVTSTFAFQLRDSLRGEGDNAGVGTGVNMNSAQALVTSNDGTGAVSQKANITYTCSGIWGSNVCDATVTPVTITAFAGDTRKWKYGTSYIISISNYEDFASPNQGQLGDANGPNRMDPKIFTFTTEADAVPPQLFNPLPAPDSVDNPMNALVSFDIQDRKTYPSGMSGSGVNAGLCWIELASPSTGSKTYKSGDAGVTTTAQDYGFRFVVDSAVDFASNETVTVRVTECADLSGNKIQAMTFSFKTLVVDTDGDGILDAVDNCPLVSNANQADLDRDGIGDVCDNDLDGDTVLNTVDNCPLVVNLDQADLDRDGIGDLCDDDIDGDTVLNTVDNCPLVANLDQKNTTKAWHALYLADPLTNAQFASVVSSPLGDACNPDIDGDTILNTVDNCPVIVNADQADQDADKIGDLCDDDIDGDTVKNDVDNCPTVPNTDQADSNRNKIGDACEAGLTVHQISAKPQKRVKIGTSQDLSLNAMIRYYSPSLSRIVVESSIGLDRDGFNSFNTKDLFAGTYNIGLKGEAHLTKMISNFEVRNSPAPHIEDFTFGNTFELIAGDIQPDDKISSFDIARMLLTYGTSGTHLADLNRDSRVGAADIALLILNYMKKGDILF